MKRLNLIAIITIGLVLLASSTEAQALNSKTTFCKSMLLDVKKIDAEGLQLWSDYSSQYNIARKSGTTEDNLNQTRTLLYLYENDRSLFLRALESRKCFTTTEIANLEMSLSNVSADAISVKSWIDVGTGIPGKKFYTSYLDLPKYLAKPMGWNFCEKKGAKYKTLTCKTYQGKLRWVEAGFDPNNLGEPTWPTDFIDGKVNLIEARKRIVKYYEDNSTAFNTNSTAAVEFMRRTSYPGLFNFDTDPKLTACRDFAALQDKAGAFKVKFTALQENIKPDPDWVLSDGTHGELLVNQKFAGQVFIVPVRAEISQGDWSDPGTYNNRHVAIIDGVVYRFSAC